jgi:hypothetical protein
VTRPLSYQELVRFSEIRAEDPSDLVGRYETVRAELLALNRESALPEEKIPRTLSELSRRGLLGNREWTYLATALALSNGEGFAENFPEGHRYIRMTIEDLQLVLRGSLDSGIFTRSRRIGLALSSEPVSQGRSTIEKRAAVGDLKLNRRTDILESVEALVTWSPTTNGFNLFINILRSMSNLRAVKTFGSRCVQADSPLSCPVMANRYLCDTPETPDVLHDRPDTRCGLWLDHYRASIRSHLEDLIRLITEWKQLAEEAAKSKT